MKTYDSQHIKTTLSSIFKRKGGAGTTTKLFDEFDKGWRDRLEREWTLDNDELPIIAGCAKDENCFMLTTERLLLRHHGELQAIPTSHIIDVAPKEFGKVRKEEMTILSIRVKGDQEIQMIVESGTPYFGVWNVLKSLVNRNLPG